jgi:hypothetical protein
MIVLIVFFFALLFSFFSIKSFIKEILHICDKVSLESRYTTIIDVVITCVLWTWFYYLTH